MTDGDRSVRLGLVGLGYWGPHYARLASELPGADLAWCCDRRPDALRLVERRYPRTRSTTDLAPVLADDTVDAVIVATPSVTHAEICTAALEAGKDVLVEKPLAPCIADCLYIRDRVGDQVVMTGHTFLYNPGVVSLRTLIGDGELGTRLFYVNSVRSGLGPIREDVNVLWDLGPHDVSILLDLATAPPVEVSAVGQSYLRSQLEDVVFLHMRFADGMLGNAHLSWLEPYKTRKVTVIGDSKMAVFDDVALDERLKVFDRGVSYSATSERSRGEGYGAYRAILRDGSITIPRLRTAEPLREQLTDFLSCVRSRRTPYSGVPEGTAVVEVLEAAMKSIRAGGATVRLVEGSDGPARYMSELAAGA